MTTAFADRSGVGKSYDAVVVGSGPNGLAAAVVLARAGRSVLLVEAADTVGGGTRTAELTLPGFRHDVCSAIHPMAVSSPFFRAEMPNLQGYGLELIHPPVPVAHPLDDGPAVLLERSVGATAAGLDPGDESGYLGLTSRLVDSAFDLFDDLLGPLGIPRHPVTAARFGLRALRSAEGLARGWFRGKRGRALFAGLAAHAVMPLDRLPTAAIGLMLGIAGHAAGWPLPRGGSQSIADALVARFRSLGGEVVTGWRVQTLAELPKARAYVMDLAPRDLARVAADRLPRGYVRRLNRYRYGPGAFKIDWALDGPIPWRDPAVARAGTVHLGGTLDEIAAAEKAVWQGRHAERPYVLVAQQSLFDPTRAPEGRHTGWAYCHVPPGSTLDQTDAIEAQVERFAPGFRDRVLARHTFNTAELERSNPNYVGGDVTGGVADLWQLFTRPVARLDPYSTPAPDVYLCSASTPPGAGVHGMGGYWAAMSLLRRRF